MENFTENNYDNSTISSYNNNGNRGSYNTNMNYPPRKQALPNAEAALVLGILSIAGCFCYGVVGLIMGIIAIVLGTKARKLYNEQPDYYSEASYKSANAGYICGIIGTSLSGLLFVIAIIVWAFVGTTIFAILSNLPH